MACNVPRRCCRCRPPDLTHHLPFRIPVRVKRKISRHQASFQIGRDDRSKQPCSGMAIACPGVSRSTNPTSSSGWQAKYLTEFVTSAGMIPPMAFPAALHFVAEASHDAAAKLVFPMRSEGRILHPSAMSLAAVFLPGLRISPRVRYVGHDLPSRASRMHVNFGSCQTKVTAGTENCRYRR